MEVVVVVKVVEVVVVVAIFFEAQSDALLDGALPTGGSWT